MKKLVFSLLALFAFISSGLAQGGKHKTAWIDLGLKGGAGTTWLMNANVFNEGTLEHAFSFGSTVGLKFGFNANNVVEFTGEGLMTFFNQKYNGKDTAMGQSWSKTVKLTQINVRLLLRLNLSGAYVELGPQLSFLNGATEFYPGDLSAFPSADVTDRFTATHMSGVFGFGRWIGTGVDNFNLALGLRFTYGFQDILSNTGGKGSTVHYPDNSAVYSDYAPTKPFSGMLILELNWDLAYLLNRTVCHRTTGR